jgi:hypothetical protein
MNQNWFRRHMTALIVAAGFAVVIALGVVVVSVIQSNHNADVRREKAKAAVVVAAAKKVARQRLRNRDRGMLWSAPCART